MTTVERRQYWQQRLAEQAASGLTPAQWCDAHGVKRRQFQDWKRRLTSATVPSQEESRWVAVPLQTTVLPSHETLLVRVGAATVEVQAGFSPALFTEVVRTLFQC